MGISQRKGASRLVGVPSSKGGRENEKDFIFFIFTRTLLLASPGFSTRYHYGAWTLLVQPVPGHAPEPPVRQERRSTARQICPTPFTRPACFALSAFPVPQPQRQPPSLACLLACLLACFALLGSMFLSSASLHTMLPSNNARSLCAQDAHNGGRSSPCFSGSEDGYLLLND